MRKIVILLILFVSTVNVAAVPPLDSLFVEAVVTANKAYPTIVIDRHELYKLVEHKGKAINSYRYANPVDTIYIISDYGAEGGADYYIITPNWQQKTNLEKFEDSDSWDLKERSEDPEIEWLKNWETDSLKKYGVFSRRVKDGIAYRYVIRYIINDEIVKTDSIKYVPNIGLLYDWSEWRKQRYGSTKIYKRPIVRKRVNLQDVQLDSVPTVPLLIN